MTASPPPTAPHLLVCLFSPFLDAPPVALQSRPRHRRPRAACARLRKSMMEVKNLAGALRKEMLELRDSGGNSDG